MLSGMLARQVVDVMRVVRKGFADVGVACVCRILRFVFLCHSTVYMCVTSCK